MEPISVKEAITAELQALAVHDQRIVAVTSDARGSASLSNYVKALPKQFVECGIAEQDEVGIAAGLAAVGKHPYIFAPACFLSARSLEQVKVDIAYSRQNVKIVGVSGGISYGALGSSHHSTHDIAVMRAIPDLAVVLPSDGVQAVAMLHDLEKRNIPVYIRTGKAKLPILYTEETECQPFVFGKAGMIRKGSDITVIACGECVCQAVVASDALKKEGISVRVLDMATLKPFDTDAVVQAAKETGHIITVEEHNINGGLGAAVCQAVCATYPIPVTCLALPDEHVVAGNSSEVFAYYGLDASGICNTIHAVLEKK
ncbi:MAG: hypothetical protein K6E51_06655 [Treponema sp.]|nr:hypothetical protein [Treponema sp.]